MADTPLRLFLAVELPPAIREALTRVRGEVPGATWVKPAAMHLTLKFLGDGISGAQVERLLPLLDAVEGRAFAFHLRGVGQFPPRGNARILWAGVEAPAALAALAGALDRAAGLAGFPRETRPFSPHITLARLRGPAERTAVAGFLQQHAHFHAGPIEADGFTLMSSVLSASGPTYTPVGRWPLR